MQAPFKFILNTSFSAQSIKSMEIVLSTRDPQTWSKLVLISLPKQLYQLLPNWGWEIIIPILRPLNQRQKKQSPLIIKKLQSSSVLKNVLPTCYSRKSLHKNRKFPTNSKRSYWPIKARPLFRTIIQQRIDKGAHYQFIHCSPTSCTNVPVYKSYKTASSKDPSFSQRFTRPTTDDFELAKSAQQWWYSSDFNQQLDQIRLIDSSWLLKSYIELRNFSSNTSYNLPVPDRLLWKHQRYHDGTARR